MAGQQAPFFLSLHYTRRTGPGDREDDGARAGRQDNLFDLAGGNIHVYRRMIHHMTRDRWIMAALEKQGMADNTLVVFTSDNGGERFSDNWPLSAARWT